MAILTRDAILQANDMHTERVEVPEWGGSVLVSSMTGRDRDRFEASLMGTKGSDTTANMANIRARLAAITCVGEDGQQIFTLKDIEALGRKSASALDRIFSVAQKMNGIGDDAVGELAGN